MGNIVTAVCTVAAFTGNVIEYYPTFNLSYTYIVNGGNCSWSVNFNDLNAQLEVFNVTNNQHILEKFTCLLTTTGCQTEYEIFGGVPGTFFTQDFEELNLTTGALTDVANLTYILVGLQPSQPPPIIDVNGQTQVAVTSSMYSIEYGASLLGCLLSVGPSNVYNGSDLPTTLYASNGVLNKLPQYSSLQTNIGQGVSYYVNLSTLNIGPNQLIDLYYVCYNSYGASYAAVRYAQTTSSALPTPVQRISSSSSSSGLPASQSSSYVTPGTAPSSSSTGAGGGGGGTTNSGTSGSSGLSGGAIAGIVIGSVVGAALLVLILCFVFGALGGRRGKKSSSSDEPGTTQPSGRYSRSTDDHNDTAGVEME